MESGSFIVRGHESTSGWYSGHRSQLQGESLCCGGSSNHLPGGIRISHVLYKRVSIPIEVEGSVLTASSSLWYRNGRIVSPLAVGTCWLTLFVTGQG